MAIKEVHVFIESTAGSDIVEESILNEPRSFVFTYAQALLILNALLKAELTFEDHEAYNELYLVRKAVRQFLDSPMVKGKLYAEVASVSALLTHATIAAQIEAAQIAEVQLTDAEEYAKICEILNKDNWIGLEDGD